MKRRGFALLVLLCVSMGAIGQYTKEFKRIYFDAGYLFETGFYGEAFNRYKNLLTLDPGNSNILFLCGACCLNIHGNELQAITYLEEASKGVSLEYKDNKYKETAAPVVTWYMLGRACHLNDRFDLAIENYQKYLDEGTDEDPLQLEYAALQIEACKRAKLVYTEAPSFEFQSVLDHFDDDLPSCNNPVVSGDGNILLFLVDYPNDKKIMMTRKEGEYWSRPRIINSEIGMVGETYPVCLSYDGTQLYVVHQFYSHSDIFVSSYENGRWSEVQDVGYNINGRTSEIHASISKDGNTLYFVSDARGGQGSFDIFVSRLDEEGEWGQPENLGPVINTPFEEHTPFISANDSILFFSSQGHSSVGGSDVFFSVLGSDGKWGEPLNLGYPVNTTDNDLFFNPGWDELESYYAVAREDDPTSNTINMVLALEAPPEEVLITALDSALNLADMSRASTEPALQMVVASASQAFRPEVDLSQYRKGPQVDLATGVQGEAPTISMPLSQPVTEPVILPSAQVEVQAPAQPAAQPPAVSPESLDEAIEPEETEDIYYALNSGRFPSEEIQPATPAATELGTSIHFDHNKYELSMAAVLEAEKVSELLQKYPGSTVYLIGHADETGSPDYNYLISCQRVYQVAQYIQNKGVHESRISIEARGEHDPMARNRLADGSDAPLGRFINRQVEIIVRNSDPMQDALSGSFVPDRLQVNNPAGRQAIPAYTFTIQLLATRNKQAGAFFSQVGDVNEHLGQDGIHRYTSGTYTSYESAWKALQNLKESGFPDAFIQTAESYPRASR